MDPNELRHSLDADPAFRQLVAKSDALNSPVLYDLLLWNVVIAFVVNVSASVAYDVLRNRLSSGEPLTQRELNENSDVLHKPIEDYDPKRVDAATNAATRVLEDQGVHGTAELVKRAVRSAAS